MPRKFVLRSDEPEVPANLTIDYEAALNRQQLDVVQSRGGPALVIAGAGTGKTRTLIYRVAYLVETGVPPHRIVLLTFTRRAAAQMIDRATALLDGRCRDVRGGTFHAFCLQILRQHAHRIGYPDTFTVLDESDAADVINLLRTERRFHKLEERFPRKDAIQSMISASVNRGVQLTEIVSTDYAQFQSHVERLKELAAAYEGYKREHGLMDYDDLLSQTYRLLKTDDQVRTRVASGCEHVLVDEYQDTNRLQSLIAGQLASVHENLMVVGDDAQSIYRFRGADYRNLFEFEDRHPGTKIFPLERNYRSTQPILDLANEVILQAKRRFDKELFTDQKEGDLPGLVPCPDERTESQFVSQMILQLREEGLPLNDIAVLFRSSYASYDLELELNRRSIPFVKYGGAKLAEAAHIKDVLAHLRVLENASDAIAWNRVLLLLEGIGPKTAADLIEWIGSVREPLENEPPLTSSRYVNAVRRLFNTLSPLRNEAPVGNQVEAIVNYLEPMLERLYPDDSDKRLRDLDHFVGLARNAESRQAFLSELVLDPVELSTIGVEATDFDEPPLVLSTIHSAKGLEFSSVFMIQLLEGSLPSSYSLGDDESVDEELRLFYVAVTRAKQHLFLTYPAVKYRRGTGDFFSDPSRFLTAIDDELLEKWELVRETNQDLLPE